MVRIIAFVGLIVHRKTEKRSEPLSYSMVISASSDGETNLFGFSRGSHRIRNIKTHAPLS
jgi:hypothetical protein